MSDDLSSAGNTGNVGQEGEARQEERGTQGNLRLTEIVEKMQKGTEDGQRCADCQCRESQFRQQRRV